MSLPKKLARGVRRPIARVLTLARHSASYPFDTPLTRDNPVVRPLLDVVVPLQPEAIARAVVYAFQQPPHVTVSEIAVRPQAEGDTELTVR